MPNFDMMKSEVTVAMMTSCVEAGACSTATFYPNSTYSNCYYGDAAKSEYPMNCIIWSGAIEFCDWVGGRLPSESEWEYAARSEGLPQNFPWGDTLPSCDYAVFYSGGYGCGTGEAWPVCSVAAGNTLQGLCDMAGNAYEMGADDGHDNYNGAPVDGSAWVTGESTKVLRGGSINSSDVLNLRTTNRFLVNPAAIYVDTGFRCVRDVN
ncbi:MAG: formylglycine-generating enzyme family protein [Deltaproteobacteria bacterium]|nr:formylglycine-generating enzyme family protein [Deltaproteobacteria bacterium]